MNQGVPVRPGSRLSAADAVAYEHPPLVEAWLTVEFAQPGPIQDAERLREMLGPEWPGFSVGAGSRDRATSRVQFTNAIGDRGVRMGPNQLSFGWLGYQGERYARYEAVRDGLVALLDSARSLNPGHELVPVRWGVEYRNRIPRGTVWSTPGEWDFVTLWPTSAWKNLDAESRGARARWQSTLDDPGSFFTIELTHRPATSAEETECVWLVLTAEGPVARPESLLDRMDFGRSVIVRRFNAMVSLEARAYWGG